MLLWPDARSKPRAALSHDQFVHSQVRYCCCCRVCGCRVRLPSLGSCTPIPRCPACIRYLRTHYLDTHDTPAIQCRYLRLAWEFLCQTTLGSDGDTVDALLRGDDSCLTARNGVCDEAMARGTDALRRQATCLPGTDSTDCRRTLATPQADLPATTLTLWSTDYHTGPYMCACACVAVPVAVTVHVCGCMCGCVRVSVWRLRGAGLISDLKHFFRTAVAPKLGDHVRIEWLDRR